MRLDSITQMPFWLGNLVLLALCLGVAYLLRWAGLELLSNSLHRRRFLPQSFNVKVHFRASAFWLLFGILSHLGLGLFHLPHRAQGAFEILLHIVLVVSATYFLIKVLELVQIILYYRFDINVEDNMRQRKIRTQIQFIFKVAVVFIGVAGFSAILMSFEGARRIGTSLIASAGVAGVVLGFAAQKSLSNLIAGFQIAFTQPVRLDDVVIVENEWGRVEEITLTYVVVNLWDLRRMVLPITYFVEKPFQNWTRASANLLAYAYVYTDFRVPVEELRNELRRIVEEDALWDRKVCVLQVTDLTEKTMQVRCLVSARNASDAFDLRCVVREKMVAFIQKNYPESLPRVRAELPQDHKTLP